MANLMSAGLACLSPIDLYMRSISLSHIFPHSLSHSLNVTLKMWCHRDQPSIYWSFRLVELFIIIIIYMHLHYTSLFRSRKRLLNASSSLISHGFFSCLPVQKFRGLFLLFLETLRKWTIVKYLGFKILVANSRNVTCRYDMYQTIGDLILVLTHLNIPKIRRKLWQQARNRINNLNRNSEYKYKLL